jgi:hypothetical protein
MEIPSETKDWTWVLQRPCEECGLEAGEIPAEHVSNLIRANAQEWVEVLHADADLRARPAPARWSPLEYACHVRDVFRLYDQRLRLMLTEDDPTYPNWDQDATAVAERYREQEPVTVAGELVEAADRLADRFDQVRGEMWSRTASRSDGAHFTVESFARYFVHDPIHHLYDVTGRRLESPSASA